MVTAFVGVPAQGIFTWPVELMRTGGWPETPILGCLNHHVTLAEIPQESSWTSNSCTVSGKLS